MQIISRNRLYGVINLAEALKKTRVYQNANYGRCPPPEDRFSDFSLRITFRFPTDRQTDGRMRAGSVTIGHDRVDIAPNDFPSPLLEEPFVSAYDFTALWFYHLNSASSDLFRRFPPSLSLSLARYLSVSVSFSPPRISSHPRAVARDTT